MKLAPASYVESSFHRGIRRRQRLWSLPHKGGGRPVHPGFLIGCFFYGTGFLMWLLILRVLPLSIAFPVAAGSLIVATQLFGVLVLKEPIAPWHIAGIAFILVGVVGLMSRDPDELVERQRDHFNKIAATYHRARRDENHLLLKELMWREFFARWPTPTQGGLKVLEAMCGFAEGKQIIEEGLGCRVEYSGFDYSDDRSLQA